MTNELNKKLKKALWSDVSSEKSYSKARPLLAHYTSITTLEQMMENNEIWFSNPLYMNDKEELRFGMNEGAATFRINKEIRNSCGGDSTHAKLIFNFDKLFQEFDSKHAFDTYVLCFSEHDPKDKDGVLSMWRGYGASGSGAALVFDTSKLDSIESSPLIIDKVHYCSREQRLAWIENKIMSIASIIKNHSLTDENLYHIALFWIERLKLFSLFTKHNGFREEKEWRVIYLSEHDPEKILTHMFGYAITSRGVEPKLKLKIQPLEGVIGESLSFEKIIDRIILGPTTATALTTNAVHRILEINGKPTLVKKVMPSSIPLRF